MNLPTLNTSTKIRNVSKYRYTLPEPEHRLRVLELSVAQLIARTKLGELWSEGFRDATRQLEAVSLATPDVVAARRHLENAFDYGALNEFGTATFELRIVRGILQRL